jgi:hypothetical protein
MTEPYKEEEAFLYIQPELPPEQEQEEVEEDKIERGVTVIDFTVSHSVNGDEA